VVLPIGQVVLSHTLFVAPRPNPASAGTGSAQHTFPEHCALLMHWITVPVHAEAPVTQAYVAPPRPIPGVAQQNGSAWVQV
jgi:hypothetical protein